MTLLLFWGRLGFCRGEKIREPDQAQIIYSPRSIAFACPCFASLHPNVQSLEKGFLDIFF